MNLGSVLMTHLSADVTEDTAYMLTRERNRRHSQPDKLGLSETTTFTDCIREQIRTPVDYIRALSLVIFFILPALVPPLFLSRDSPPRSRLHGYTCALRCLIAMVTELLDFRNTRF